MPKSWGSTLRMSLMLIRPFHIVHQLALIFMSISLKEIRTEVTLGEVFLIWLTVFLVMPLLFAINDILHLEEDKRMGRKRLFTTIVFPPKVLAGLLTGLLILLLILATLRNIFTLLFLIILIVVASLYGYFKHKRKTILTYSFRMLSGIALYLVISSYFELSQFDFLIAIFVGISDLTVHIIGDVRDYTKDSIGGVRTLPILLGLEKTNYIFLILLHADIAFLFLIGSLSPRFSDQAFPQVKYLIWIYLLYIVGYLVYSALLQRREIPYQWLHACLHGPKVLSFVLIGSLYNGVGYDEFWILLLFIIFWAISYTSYLWADDRL